MIDHETLTGADIVDQRVLGAVVPAQLEPAALVVEDAHFIRRERFRPGSAQLFSDANNEAARVFRQFAQHRRSGAPVVAALTGDNKGLELRRPGGLGKREGCRGEKNGGRSGDHKEARL